MKPNQPGTGSSRSGRGPFTRALLFFFAGTCLFFVNSHVADRLMSILLAVGGSILFGIGFVLASLGKARHWRDDAARIKYEEYKKDRGRPALALSQSAEQGDPRREGGLTG
jgi:hypothetical protein